MALGRPFNCWTDGYETKLKTPLSQQCGTSGKTLWELLAALQKTRKSEARAGMGMIQLRALQAMMILQGDKPLGQV